MMANLSGVHKIPGTETSTIVFNLTELMPVFHLNNVPVLLFGAWQKMNRA